MAPRGRRATEATEEPQAFHQFGVRGRKTGVAIPNTGEVDDQGFQPLEAIFSSPTKPSQSGPRNSDSENEEGNDDNDDEDDDEDGGSEDMDISSSAGPGPRTLLKEQRTLQYPIPRSRSPIKTALLSPARRSRLVAERYSSPLVDEREPTVTRKINFPSRPTGKAKLGARTNGNGNGVNGTVPESEGEEDEDDDDGDEEQPLEDTVEEDDGPEEVGGEDDPVEIVGAQDETEDEQLVEDQGGVGDDNDNDDDDDDEDEVEGEDEPVVEKALPIKRPRGRPSTSLVREDGPKAGQESAKKQKGRPPKSAKRPTAAEEGEKEGDSQPVRGSRKRRSRGSEEDDAEDPQHNEIPADEDDVPRQKKRQRTAQESRAATAPAAAKPGRPAKPAKSEKSADAPPEKPKGRAGRPKAKAKAVSQEAADPDAGEASFLALQKGPPMPKRRGLVSVKRDPDVIVQTRAGRQSYRPLNWWAGDRVITEVEERQDIGRSAFDFVTATTKEVYRATPDEDTRPRRGGGRGGRGRGRGGRAKSHMAHAKEEEVDEDEPLEDWELDRGIVEGEVMGWEPEYERHPPADDDQVNVTEDLLAISGDAVQTKDIKDATFRFAKTLTTPFMGAGIVDLPPGTEKRPKNSRKMHMVFFVHTGKVLVTVNETEFRISAGGQWFVPRGNYYSITNDYDKPARIFFAQANEVTVEAVEG